MPYKDPEKRKACAKECGARWRAKNREAERERTGRWREENHLLHRTRTRDCMRRWRQSPENQELNRRQVAAWREKNRERDRASSRKWRRDNPQAQAAQSRRKRAAKKGAGGRGVTAAAWDLILAAFDCRCAYCGEAYESMDHMVPLSRGREHDVLNVVPACWTCNSTKNAKTALEFVWGRL